MLRLFINASSLKAYKSGEDIIGNKKKSPSLICSILEISNVTVKTQINLDKKI